MQGNHAAQGSQIQHLFKQVKCVFDMCAKIISVNEIQLMFSRFGSNQSQRQKLLDAARAFIVEMLKEGYFTTDAMFVALSEFTDRISRNSLGIILHDNCEGAWYLDGEMWRLVNDKGCTLIHGNACGGQSSSERLFEIQIRQELAELVRLGEIGRTGSSGKYFKLSERAAC